MPFRKLLLAIDVAAEPPPLAATRALARRFASEVTAVYVKRPVETTPAAVASLEHVVRSELPELSARCLVLEGDPRRRIVEAAALAGADLVAVFPREDVGSVSASVLVEARCAVWTVSPRAGARPFPDDFRIGRVLCGVDFTRNDRVTVPAADVLAREVAAELTLAHALPTTRLWGPGGNLERPEHKARSIATAHDRLMELQRALHVRATTFADTAETVADGLNDAVTSLAADVLVIGRRPAPGVVGGNCRRIVGEAVVPVLAVPT